MTHHHHHGEPDWRRFEAMARRGFGRLSGLGKFGNWDGFGDNFRIGRMLASGDLRLVALYFIERQPRHGYDLIKAIEDKSHGFYSPSPGIVYPALTFLEEAGYTTSSAEGNKKLYTITEEGRAHLADNRQAIETTLDFLGKAGEKVNAWRERMTETEVHEERHSGGGSGGGGRTRDRDIPGVVPELNDARRALKAAIAEAIDDSEETQRRVAEILRKAAAEIRGKGADVDL